MNVNQIKIKKVMLLHNFLMSRAITGVQVAVFLCSKFRYFK